MGSSRPLVISLSDPRCREESIVGGKASTTSRLAAGGFRVPGGFAITVFAYESFIMEHGIDDAIRMELGRKPLDDMRWEEIWDAALRLRSLFLGHALSPGLVEAVAAARDRLGRMAPIAVRSSARGEDSAGRSFAGLHESMTGVTGDAALAQAIRLVWASLWSDAALLYRRELDLDPSLSRMAVLVQEMVSADRSGVAFGRDPRGSRADRAIIEAVPGPCKLLVDGTVDPDRWEIERDSRRVLTWKPGRRHATAEPAVTDVDATRQGARAEPLLDATDLEAVLNALFSIEDLFGWDTDMEWTGRARKLTILQSRPITTAASDPDDPRGWYLTLRPGDEHLRKLRGRVADELIPELEAEGRRLARADVERMSDQELAHAIEERFAIFERWKKIYWDEFIPFAHGVRRLAVYYNDAVQPDDPYEFVGLLRDQALLASERNRILRELADGIREHGELAVALGRVVHSSDPGPLPWRQVRGLIRGIRGADRWTAKLEKVSERFFDVAYKHRRLADDSRPLLKIILELAQESDPPNRVRQRGGPAELERRLLAAVGAARAREAVEVIETGRVSWKLRDDDNLLVGRIESQLLRALDVAASRLASAGRLIGKPRPDAATITTIARALSDPRGGVVEIEAEPEAGRPRRDPRETPRQLIGQPAAPGLATGPVRRIRGLEDLGRFRQGDVMVCDAIQPTITHLVPLARAIVERRGGMLIHGAIIARELGIPCVNGVQDATEILDDDEIVTVDGYLGIVTVGPPEFDLELGPRP